MGCEVKWDAFGIRCLYTDYCSYTDCREALAQIHTRYSDRKPTYVVHDFTDARELAHGLAAWVALAAPCAKRGPVDSAQHCAVVSPDSAVVALVASCAAQVRRPIQAFTSRADAQAWLVTLFA